MMVFLFSFPFSPPLKLFETGCQSVSACSGLFFCCCNLKKKSWSLFSLHFMVLKGSQGRNSRQQHGGRAGRRDCGSTLLPGLFSSWLQNHLPRCPTSQDGLSSPTSVISEENAHTGLHRGPSEGSIFSAEVPFSKVTLACISILPAFVVSSKE